MKRHTLRTHVAAAAMLLTPMAALVAVQPVHAQRAVAPSAIHSISINADEGISPGSTLRIELQASRDARNASVALGGTDIVVPLQQVRSGLYRGTYTVRRSDRIDPMQMMTARVRHGERTIARSFSFPPSFQALAMGGAPQERERRSRVPHDNRAPQITDLTPAHGDRIGERGRTHISARLSDQGSGIDPDSVRLRLAGRDVSDDVRVANDEVRLRRDLEPGRYTAEISVADRAGNRTTKQWTFDVIDRDRVGLAPASGPLPLQVTSHSDGALVDNPTTLVLHGRTAPFATVRIEVDTASPAGMRQVLDQTVEADRNGVFNVPVSPSGYVIPGGRYQVRVTASSGRQTAQEHLTLHRRQG